ncbi:MAG: Asp-tRNA(Asn)/Glu-tRNA(Gln) amidotransferase subunit GatC [Alphaproteobacteria bacterium]|nr:Asp-tRNA(Asn)/Glu-tRNA(Gln) amidotransferase subunit GatC [Alphaproteobacteria bacterium]
MSLDKETVAKIAHLARIHVPQQDLTPLAGELSKILDWVEQLNRVDTEGVAPMTSVVAIPARWREDEVTDGGYPDDVLANAPEAEHGFYIVPKVVE